MEVAEDVDNSRPPLAAMSLSQQNTETEVDFSKVSVSQFGITTSSFLSSPKINDKSRVAQLKARRRSAIGVRGSPETNSLICFRARQAAKTPPRTPQLDLLQRSPFVSHCDSLKKKMAAFQCLMEEDEEEKALDKQKKKEDGMKNAPVDSQNGKENMLTTLSPAPCVTPPPSKKRCRAPSRECEDKITETSLPCPALTKQQEQGRQCCEPESQISVPALGSDSKNELLSLPMLCKPETKTADGNEMSSVCKKKRVRFGAPLSPEFFDKNLPPSTPLQKGGTPMCPPSSTGKKLSLLKTPQRFEPSLSQPDFNSPQSNGASPVLVIDTRSTRLVYSDDVFESFEKITFPSMDEESPINGTLENCKDILYTAEESGQPQAEETEVMNAAFQLGEDEPSASWIEEKLPSATSDQPSALSEVEVDLKSAGNSEQQLSFNASTKPTRSNSRKRKQPGESETETRRSSRTAAVSASGKMKKTSGNKRRFGNKEVDRSLYGKRDFASKNPLLSPIFEMTSISFNNTPSQTPSGKPKDGIRTPVVPHNQPAHSMVSLWSSTALSEATLTNENEQMGVTCLEPSNVSESPKGSKPGSKACRARRGSGRPARQRRSSGTTKRRSLSNPALVSTAETDEHQNQKFSEGSKLHESENTENTEPEASVSYATPTVVPNGDCMTNKKTPSGKSHGRVVVAENVVYETEITESKNAPTEIALAPWQQDDFNIDDILKPVAKSRGSVRRSLRNRRSVDLQAVGLAWVDHTSPEFNKVGKRRRSRLSGVSEQCVTLISDEQTPNLEE